MNPIATVKFLLKGGTFLTGVVSSESVARQIVQDWLDKRYKIKGQTFMGGSQIDGQIDWAVDLDEVSACHIEMIHLPQQGSQQNVPAGFEGIK